MTIPEIQPACIEVLSENAENLDFFCKKISELDKSQPHLLKCLLDSCAAFVSAHFEPDSDEYAYFFMNSLGLAVQTYNAIEKQLQCKELEDLIGR